MSKAIIRAGAFSHSAGTAPIITVFIPGTPLKTEACMIHSKQHWGCRIQDPGTRCKHQTKTKNPRCTSRGCRVQNSGPWDPWLPVVKNSRLFAQRTVRPQQFTRQPVQSPQLMAKSVASHNASPKRWGRKDLKVVGETSTTRGSKQKSGESGGRPSLITTGEPGRTSRGQGGSQCCQEVPPDWDRQPP